MFGRLVIVLLAVFACAGDTRQDSSAIIDDLGRQVDLAGPARRVVSLSPAITEVLFTIGAGGRVVGRTQWGDYPAAVGDVPSVGDGLNPSVEAVAARNPDLVVFYASSANAAAIEHFAALGIATASLQVDRLAHVGRVARLLGALTASGDIADSIAAAFESRLAERGAAARDPSCDVAIIVWDSPPMIIGAGSFLTELIELAGGRNVFDDVATPDAEVSIESIAARDPDVLLTFGFDSIPAYAAREEWRVVPAVRNRRFVSLAGSQFEYPSFRAIEAADELSRVLSCDD